MYNIFFIRRRFPDKAGKIIFTLFAASALLLLLGVGLLILL